MKFGNGHTAANRYKIKQNQWVVLECREDSENPAGPLTGTSPAGHLEQT